MTKVDEWIAKLSDEIGDQPACEVVDYQYVKLCLKRIKEICDGSSNELNEEDANIYYRALCISLTNASKVIKAKYGYLI